MPEPPLDKDSRQGLEAKHHMPVASPLNDVMDATFGSRLPGLNDCRPLNTPSRGGDARHDYRGLRALLGGLFLGSTPGLRLFRVGAEHVLLDLPAPEALGEGSDDRLAGLKPAEFLSGRALSWTAAPSRLGLAHTLAAISD